MRLFNGRPQTVGVRGFFFRRVVLEILCCLLVEDVVA